MTTRPILMFECFNREVWNCQKYRKSFFLSWAVLAVGNQLTQVLPQVLPVPMPFHRIHLFLRRFLYYPVQGQFECVIDEPREKLGEERT